VELLRRREGGVEILTLNRPEQRNALSPALIGALSTAFRESLEDDSVRAIVLTGAGDRAFCAGMDLKAFAAGEDSMGASDTEHFRMFSGGMYPKPVVGAANATAVAGGFELLLNCDLVVAADQARFGIPEVKRGLFAAGGGTTLPARIPLAIALELGLTGELVDAERAYQLGLVNRVLPAESVLDAALDYARRISENGPLAVLATKKLMRTAYLYGVEASREAQAEWQPKVFGSQDAREGALAFAEKRVPNWSGR